MKTINFFKTTGLVLVFILTANFAYSTSGAVAMAKKELHQSITDVFSDDISKRGNYLYENDIYKLNDKAEVILRVKDNGELELIDVKCKNCDAAEYIKYVIGLNKVKADQVLFGQAFSVDVRLRFKAK